MLKEIVYQICPPFLWKLLFSIKQNLQDKNLKAIVGENTAINGAIDQRVQGGEVKIGNDCLIEGYLVTESHNSKITIGNNVFIGGGTVVDCVISISVEDDVLVSYGCILADSDNHSVSYSIRKHDLADWKKGKHAWNAVKSLPIKISKGAWIGAHAIILKGVTIGEGAVIGAGSVVTRDIPAWTIAAGNPARIIREIPEHER